MLNNKVRNKVCFFFYPFSFVVDVVFCIVPVCAAFRTFNCIVYNVTLTIHTKQEKRCSAHLNHFSLVFSLIPHI